VLDTTSISEIGVAAAMIAAATLAAFAIRRDGSVARASR
jgi:hypothetical protein